MNGSLDYTTMGPYWPAENVYDKCMLILHLIFGEWIGICKL